MISRWLMWGFWLVDDDCLGIITPWFSILMSCGGADWLTDSFWWGWSTRWSYDPTATLGQWRFKKSAEHIIRRVTYEHVFNFGGLS